MDKLFEHEHDEDYHNIEKVINILKGFGYGCK